MSPGEGLVGGTTTPWWRCPECRGEWSWTAQRIRHRSDCPRLEEQRQQREADALRNPRAPIISGCVFHDWDGDPLDCPGCIEVGDRDDSVVGPT